jgi:hypothetical protein
MAVEARYCCRVSGKYRAKRRRLPWVLSQIGEKQEMARPIRLLRRQLSCAHPVVRRCPSREHPLHPSIALAQQLPRQSDSPHPAEDLFSLVSARENSYAINV